VSVTRFRGTLGAKVITCNHADPGDQGSGGTVFHDYLEKPFLPGRSFISPAEFNQQL
jgi:hypothetical protein